MIVLNKLKKDFFYVRNAHFTSKKKTYNRKIVAKTTLNVENSYHLALILGFVFHKSLKTVRNEMKGSTCAYYNKQRYWVNKMMSVSVCCVYSKTEAIEWLGWQTEKNIFPMK